jgi:glycosyltransferase involved in cell wall biosynthesis
MDDIPHVALPTHNYLQHLSAFSALLEQADVIYAVKPLLSSYGLALLARLRRKFPLILDIDDWEIGFVKWRLAQTKKGLLKFYAHDWVGGIFLLDKLTRLANKITVSSTFLAKRYGGTIVPHGQDTNLLNPARYNIGALREKLGFSDEKIILFLGTPRPYKGLADLIEAVKLLAHKKTRILLVGANPNDPYTQALAEQAGDILRIEAMKPLAERPLWLAVADLVAIPQHLSPATLGQVPAKLFDAMAMAKPIVATAVSDVPQILNGCGYIVPPGDVQALAKKVEYVLDNTLEAKERGLLARQKCVSQYSWEAMGQTLKEVFAEYEPQ